MIERKTTVLLVSIGRSHHDFVDIDDVYPFLMKYRNYNINLDVMVEAKQKDRAMLQLVKELDCKPGIRVINDAAIEIL